MPFFVNFGYSRQGETKEAMIDVHQNLGFVETFLCWRSRVIDNRCNICIVKTAYWITLHTQESKAVTQHVFWNNCLPNIADIFLSGKEYVKN